MNDISGSARPDNSGDGAAQWAASANYERAVSCLSRMYENYLDASCTELGVTGSQVPLLMYLWQGHSGATQNQIAHALGVDKGTISRNVRSLVQAGLISQDACERDTRACSISLTQAGADIAQPVMSVTDRWTAAVTAGMSSRQRERLAGQLQQMADRAIEFTSASR